MICKLKNSRVFAFEKGNPLGICLATVILLLTWCVSAIGEENEAVAHQVPVELSEKEWFLKGISAFREDDFEEAIRCYENALRSPVDWEEYTYFYLLQTKWKAGYLAETMGICKAFPFHCPESPLLDQVAVIQAKGYGT